MAFDNEVRERFKDIECILEKHDERIQQLEIQFAKSNVKLENIESAVCEIKNASQQNISALNSVLSTLNQMVLSSFNNDTTKKTSDAEVKKEKIKQIGLILATVFGSSALFDFIKTFIN